MLKGLLVFIKSYIDGHIFVALVVLGWFMWDPMQLAEFIVDYMMSINGVIVLEGLIVLYSMNSVANSRAGLDYSDCLGVGLWWNLWVSWVLVRAPWLFIFYLGGGESQILWKIYLLYVGIVLYVVICIVVFGRIGWFVENGEARVDKDYVLIYMHIILLVYWTGVLHGFDGIKSVVMTFDFFLYFALLTYHMIKNKGWGECSWMKKWSEPVLFDYDIEGKRVRSYLKSWVWLRLLYNLFLLYNLVFICRIIFDYCQLLSMLGGGVYLIFYGFYWAVFIHFCAGFFSRVQYIWKDKEPDHAELRKRDWMVWYCWKLGLIVKLISIKIVHALVFLIKQIVVIQLPGSVLIVVLWVFLS